MSSKAETETVITWTLADEKAVVYTLMPKIVKQCKRAKGEEIRKDEGVRNGRKEAFTFIVDPECIVIRRRREKRDLSPKQLAKLREHGFLAKKPT